MEKKIIAIAAGLAAVFAVTSIADLRKGDQKVVPLVKKREQIEKEMRDKQEGHPLSDTDQEKVLEKLALYAELYKHPLHITEVVSETGYVRVKYYDGREERFYRVPDEI
jgi:hypothetical protein